MAGRPKRRAMVEELERLTREYFDVEEGADNTHTHLDFAIARIESGAPIAAIAREVGEGIGLDVQRQVLSAYLHDTFPEAKERLETARPAMAEAMAEDALSIIDQVPADKLDLAHNSARARTRESLAKMFHPDRFNPAKNGGLTVNLGQWHLDALRMFSRGEIASAPPDLPALPQANHIEQPRPEQTES